MSDLQIEIGKFYAQEGRANLKLICVDVPNKKRNYYLFYKYEDVKIKALFDHEVVEWKEEPKVGWVYDDIHDDKIKIIADINKHTDEHCPGLINSFVGVHIKMGTLYVYNEEGIGHMHRSELKLETGRPADE